MLVLFFVIVSFENSIAQSTNLGIPPIRNFSKKSYHAGTQNWQITQGKEGRIYVANNEGLLEFNGSVWSLFPVKNNTIVRSLYQASDGRIYVGAQSEFGYFSPNTKGQLEYHSLTDMVPEEAQNFTDIWDIVEWEGAFFFRWDKAIFEYRNNAIKVHPTTSPIRSFFQTDQGLFVQKENGYIWKWGNGSFSQFMKEPSLTSSLKAIIEWSADTLLFCSLKNGIFYLQDDQLIPWKTQNDALLKEKRISAATLLRNGQLALCTALHGLLIFDKKKRIFKHLDKGNGLQGNNVLSIFEDKSGIVWLGLDNGLDCVDLASPFSIVFPDKALEGTGYAAQAFDGRFYLGVSNGVYVADWKNYYNPEQAPFFKKIRQTDGQVWNLQVEQNQLWLGHHEGAFDIKNETVKKLSPHNGFWKFIPLSEDYLMAGTYTGLVLFKKNGPTWQDIHHFEDLKESCRIMVRDKDGTIWVSHPYRGLYRVKWSAENPKKIDVKFYNAESGLPSNLNNYVFKIAQKALFGTEKGVFRYNSEADNFERDSLFSKTIGATKRVSCLQEDKTGNIWFVADKAVGLIEVDDFGLKKKLKVKHFEELTDRLVGGFEMIYPLDEENVFFGAERGFVHYNPTLKESSDTSLNILITSVHLQSHHDSLLYGGYSKNSSELNLSAENNNLNFTFSATDFHDPNLLLFRTRLIGLNTEWSEWSPIRERSYTNLSDGDYAFEAQGKVINGMESSIARYEFSISPPWYASMLAKTIYVIGVLLSWFSFWYWQKQNYESEKAQLTEIHEQKEKAAQKTVEQTKAALVTAQNEILQTEIEARNKELALSTMHIVQKGEMLTTIRERLNGITEISNNATVKKEVQQLLNLLNYDESRDEDWAHFARHFDRVHVDFLERLRTKYPQISSNDQKLSAYLRMNLSTKEIATMMNISVRGVEASRYRLRKRLALEKEVNLNEFIMGV